MCPQHKANLDSVGGRQCRVGGRHMWHLFAVCRPLGHSKGSVCRVPWSRHTAKAPVAVCQLFAVCFGYGARQSLLSLYARGFAESEHVGTRELQFFGSELSRGVMQVLKLSKYYF